MIIDIIDVGLCFAWFYYIQIGGVFAFKFILESVTVDKNFLKFFMVSSRAGIINKFLTTEQNE